LLSGLAVDDHDTGALGGEMLVAPREQRPEHRPEIAAGLRQHIFVSRRSFAVAAAFEEASLDQRLQAPRQHVRRDAQVFLERVEPRQPVEGVAQNEDAPPFPDPLQTAGDRALHVAEALAPHRVALHLLAS
jgi:hypothetical protein